MKVVLASTNRGKLRELRALLPDWELEPLRADTYPEEEGATFYENARAKAAFARSIASDVWTLGEDSGLEVNALGGQPGIRSARFAGPAATDDENVAKLLDELAGVPGERRRARYVSELVLISPAPAEFRATGTLSGRIAEERRGSEGFGYDPVFIPNGHGQTVAELGNAWKAVYSHRAVAARALLDAVGEAPEAV